MSKITKRFVESIIPHSRKTLIFWDTELKGFGVVVLPSGRTTYCIQYRNTAYIKKRLKVGVHGQITAEQARDLAKKYLSQVVQGKDPMEQKKAEMASPRMKELATQYFERHAERKRLKSQNEDKTMLNKYILPAFGDKRVSQVTFHEIQTLHLKLKATPYRANRVLALLSKMFSLAISWGWRTDNPVLGIERYQEEKRDRWLNDEELQRVWGILEAYPKHITAYVFKFLILTGARKGEVLQATWDQFDLEKGIWTKPAHLTKQKKKEHLPISDRALEVLYNLKKMTVRESPYLFPGKISGAPLQEIKTFWKRVLKEASLENVRIHDLRHTHASHLVSSGLSLSIVGKLLGHTQATTTHRYAHLADEPLRQAAELFGSKFNKFVS
ncbi:MAG: tyrosine-type recombinase/integrase [Alphaproteobacteria bacterium]|nr:tyrosine-type recombinase/integrase [Alphaproteobacteria bacterium]